MPDTNSSTNATLDEMKNNDFIPFIKEIEAGADVIMVGHISCPNVTGNNIAASLSGQYGVLQAVQNGSIPEDQINESLRRILELKLRKM